MRTQLKSREELDTRRALEIERKFVVDDDARFPGLESLGGFRVGSSETVNLDAVYYDTNDYRLARSGASLRLRLGGSDSGWHLKLPGPSSDARLELRRPASASDTARLSQDPPPVPDELRDLTLSRTGGRRLQPVVRLTTRRTKTLLLDPASRPLAEVDQDEVGAFLNGDPEPHEHWKELEIELLEGSPEQLAEISRRLERSGSRPADYPSKFVRAVGTAASSPLVGEPRNLPGPGASVGDVFAKRWHDLVVELMARDVGVRLGEPEAVHKMRVAIRRMRSALKTFSPVLDRESARWLRDELRWLGLSLGAVRDADVLRGQLEEMLGSLPEAEVIGPIKDEIGTHFARTRQRALAAALTEMRSERYLELVNVLRAVSVAPPLQSSASRAVHTAGPKLLRRELRRVRRRVDALDDKQDGELELALHEVRKTAKGMRYAAEAFVASLGPVATRIAERFEAIHEDLGTGQDAVVARELLRELGSSKGVLPGHNGYTYGLLAGIEESRFDRAASELPRLWEKASSKKLWRSLKHGRSPGGGQAERPAGK